MRGLGLVTLVEHNLDAMCIQMAIDLSPPIGLSTPDVTNRWVLHQVIDTLSLATARSLDWSNLAQEMLKLVDEIVQIYPDVLTKVDGRTGLIPFLQATAQDGAAELFSVSLSFQLLRMDPNVLRSFS